MVPAIGLLFGSVLLAWTMLQSNAQGVGPEHICADPSGFLADRVLHVRCGNSVATREECCASGGEWEVDEASTTPEAPPGECTTTHPEVCERIGGDVQMQESCSDIEIRWLAGLDEESCSIEPAEDVIRSGGFPDEGRFGVARHAIAEAARQCCADHRDACSALAGASSAGNRVCASEGAWQGSRVVDFQCVISAAGCCEAGGRWHHNGDMYYRHSCSSGGRCAFGDSNRFEPGSSMHEDTADHVAACEVAGGLVVNLMTCESMMSQNFNYMPSLEEMESDDLCRNYGWEFQMLADSVGCCGGGESICHGSGMYPGDDMYPESAAVPTTPPSTVPPTPLSPEDLCLSADAAVLSRALDTQCYNVTRAQCCEVGEWQQSRDIGACLFTRLGPGSSREFCRITDHDPSSGLDAEETCATLGGLSDDSRTCEDEALQILEQFGRDVGGQTMIYDGFPGRPDELFDHTDICGGGLLQSWLGEFASGCCSDRLSRCAVHGDIPEVADINICANEASFRPEFKPEVVCSGIDAEACCELGGVPESVMPTYGNYYSSPPSPAYGYDYYSGVAITAYGYYSDGLVAYGSAAYGSIMSPSGGPEETCSPRCSLSIQFGVADPALACAVAGGEVVPSADGITCSEGLQKVYHSFGLAREGDCDEVLVQGMTKRDMLHSLSNMGCCTDGLTVCSDSPAPAESAAGSLSICASPDAFMPSAVFVEPHNQGRVQCFGVDVAACCVAGGEFVQWMGECGSGCELFGITEESPVDACDRLGGRLNYQSLPPPGSTCSMVLRSFAAYMAPPSPSMDLVDAMCMGMGMGLDDLAASCCSDGLSACVGSAEQEPLADINICLDSSAFTPQTKFSVTCLFENTPLHTPNVSSMSSERGGGGRRPPYDGNYDYFWYSGRGQYGDEGFDRCCALDGEIEEDRGSSCSGPIILCRLSVHSGASVADLEASCEQAGGTVRADRSSGRYGGRVPANTCGDLNDELHELLQIAVAMSGMVSYGYYGSASGSHDSYSSSASSGTATASSAAGGGDEDFLSDVLVMFCECVQRSCRLPIDPELIQTFQDRASQCCSDGAALCPVVADDPDSPDAPVNMEKAEFERLNADNNFCRAGADFVGSAVVEVECRGITEEACSASGGRPRTEDSGTHWSVQSGPCYTRGSCVYSGGFPNDYEPGEACTIVAVSAFDILVERFETEYGSDRLSIDGAGFSGGEGPQGISVVAGTRLDWSTDASETRSGWALCGEQSRGGTHWTCPTEEEDGCCGCYSRKFKGGDWHDRQCCAHCGNICGSGGRDGGPNGSSSYGSSSYGSSSYVYYGSASYAGSRKCPLQHGSCILSSPDTPDVVDACLVAGGSVVKKNTCDYSNWLAREAGVLEDSSQCSRVPNPPDDRSISDYLAGWAGPCCAAAPHVCDPEGPGPGPTNVGQQEEVEVHEVMGSITLTLGDVTAENAAAFASNPAVEATLKTSIAELAGPSVSSGDVKVDITVVDPSEGGRLLQAVSVRVDYTIAAESAAAANALSAEITEMRPEAVVTQVNEELAAADNIDVRVTGAEIDTPTISTRMESRFVDNPLNADQSDSWRSASSVAACAVVPTLLACLGF